MAESSVISDLVRSMVQALVDDPGAVSIGEVPGQTVTIIEIRVAREDIPKVIGREGRTADAIRTIMGAAGQKLGRRLIVELLE